MEAGSGLREDARRFESRGRDVMLPNEYGRQNEPFAPHLIEKDANLALVRAADRYAGGDRRVIVRMAFTGTVAVSVRMTFAGTVTVVMGQVFAGGAMMMAGGKLMQTVAEHGNPAVSGE